MEIFVSEHGLSVFKRQKIQQKLLTCGISIRHLTSRYIFLVDLAQALTSEKSLKLIQVLGIKQAADDLPQGELFFVIPRLGTVSPWCSKATDILHNVGLTEVNRCERGIAFYIPGEFNPAQRAIIAGQLHDPLTQTVLPRLTDATALFNEHSATTLDYIDILQQGESALIAVNQSLGLALSETEISYLYQHFKQLERNPTDVELMMFAQANSEHCRHKIFNAKWNINGITQQKSLFQMIKHTHQVTPDFVLSAYQDNAAVMQGNQAGYWATNSQGCYQYNSEYLPVLMKVETHNHPTAISPFAGAATGSGGEIRDEGATGLGGKPKAALVGFNVSNLQLPTYSQPWETDYGKPTRLASPLEIMLDGPLGSAGYNNEFGRPCLLGYFRTFEQAIFRDGSSQIKGYRKPIMLAGGLGNLRLPHVTKTTPTLPAKLIVLGGAAMNIGLGGGAASSMVAGASDEQLDFASVQRDNPEMARRCQEVIDHCCQLGEDNPIAFIHDVGAGGLANALPELIHDAAAGGLIELRDIDVAEHGMSPLAIWCNESQERFVLAIADDQLDVFAQFCQRERAPYAVVGELTPGNQLKVSDNLFNKAPVDVSLSLLFNDLPPMQRDIVSKNFTGEPFNTQQIAITDAVTRVLSLPTVADKGFLITIGDRSVTGLVCRDQLVGPWQVPVADCAVTTTSFDTYAGEAMSMGERPPIALLNPAASARMAVAESMLNICATNIGDLKRIKLSANWMAAAGEEGEDAGLYQAVKAIGEELCPQLGLTIPVGKDSLSMKTQWQQDNQTYEVSSPLSLVISAFALVKDVRLSVTPELRKDKGETCLLFVDLANGKQRMGGSALAQVYQQLGDIAPDLDCPLRLKNCFNITQHWLQEKQILAYHDKSDGGLLVTMLEMAFAGNTGLKLDISHNQGDAISCLFNEELGAVLQVPEHQADKIIDSYLDANIDCHRIGQLTQQPQFNVINNQQTIFSQNLSALREIWSATSYQMQKLRDNPECAAEEYALKQSADYQGLQAKLTFDPADDIAAPFIAKNIRPKVAILREQGVNSQREMAAAFDRAGFAAFDVHMSDILSGKVSLTEFQGMAACGGFSYGDVLGAGKGWASSILFNSLARDEFSAFFAKKETFTLGVCNGCQMLSLLTDIIPGSQHWPKFVDNRSERYEGRVAMVKIEATPSLFLTDMAGSQLPVAVAHAQGQVNFANLTALAAAEKSHTIALRYVDDKGEIANQYPLNPNGSVNGITGLTSLDGRVTIMMPHPERVFRTVSNSWHPDSWGEDAPWMRLFRNARRNLG